MEPDSEENHVGKLESLWLVGPFSEMGEQDGEGILYSLLDHVKRKSIESRRWSRGPENTEPGVQEPEWVP